MAKIALSRQKKLTLKKSGDTTSGDGSNFNGQNAVFLAAGGAEATLHDIIIDSNSEGSNAIFATGERTKVNVNNVTITTSQNSSRGLDATYNGSIIAKDINIVTKGDHSAALATDRGEGTIPATDGFAQTFGDDSPVIYSTGNISATNIRGSAEGSEIVVIEGKNSITMDNVTLTGKQKHGVMLYQSFSGDAESGTATFTANNSNLTSEADGSMFYITNTYAIVNVDNTKLTFNSPLLISVKADHWGQTGSNGGDFEMNVVNETMIGNIEADNISTVVLSLGKQSEWTGAVNAENTAKNITGNMTSDAVWNMTGESYVKVLSDDDNTYANINSDGHNIYYVSESNPVLGGQTIDLPGGGKLMPVNSRFEHFTKLNNN